MKCPLCNHEGLEKSKIEGYVYCNHCRCICKEDIADDPDLTLYKYKLDFIRSKDYEPKSVFEKSINKFEKGGWTVIGANINKHSQPSFFFGQEYIVVLRKKKSL